MKDYMVSICDCCGKTIMSYSKYYTVKLGYHELDVCEHCITEHKPKDDDGAEDG